MVYRDISDHTIDTDKMPNKLVIERFSSVKEAIDVCMPNADDSASDNWYGGILEDITSKLLRGDTNLVNQCEMMMGKVKDIELPGTYGSVRHRDVFGSGLSFGDYASGSPTPFRRSRRVINDVSPLKIVVGITTSSSIDAAQQQQRGMAVLALVQKIQAVRPIELFALGEYGTSAKDGTLYQMVEINTKPLDLATAITALSHVGLPRKFFQGRGLGNVELRQKIRYGGGWAYGYKSNSKGYDLLRRKCLGLSENDLVIDSLCAQDKFLYDPLGWVNNQLEQVKERCLLG